MKLSGVLRRFFLAVFLSVSAWSAHADITLFAKNDGFSGSDFQFRFYDFSIGLPGLVTATLVDTTVVNSFASLGMAIFKTGSTAVAPPLLAPGQFSFSVAPGATGSYTALVFGEPVAPLSTFGVLVTQVPEPEIWALMLVGTGLVGFQLRRKRKAAEANRLA